MSTGSSNTTADRFLTQLVERTHLSAVSAERVRRVQQETLDRSAAVLLKLGLLSEAGLATEMAAFSGCALVGERIIALRGEWQSRRRRLFPARSRTRAAERGRSRHHRRLLGRARRVRRQSTCVRL